MTPGPKILYGNPDIVYDVRGNGFNGLVDIRDPRYFVNKAERHVFSDGPPLSQNLAPPDEPTAPTGSNEQPHLDDTELFFRRDAGLYGQMLLYLLSSETRQARMDGLRADLDDDARYHRKTLRHTRHTKSPIPPLNPSGPPDPNRYAELYSKRAYRASLDTPAGQKELIARIAGQAKQFDLAKLPHLLQIINEGKEARRALVLRHTPLLLFATRALAKHQSDNWNEGLRERLSAGYTGLLRAVDGYDPGTGLTFTTYAIRCIDSAIRRHYERADCQRLGLTRSQRTTRYKILGAKSQLEEELGREPTAAEISQKVRMRESTVQRYLGYEQPVALNQTPISVLVSPAYRDNDLARGHDIEDTNPNSRPETQAEESEFIALLEQMAEVADLSPEQKYVIAGSYRQGEAREVDAAIAAEMGMTVKKVRAIRQSAREKLAKSKPAIKMLAEFLATR